MNAGYAAIRRFSPVFRCKISHYFLPGGNSTSTERNSAQRKIRIKWDEGGATEKESLSSQLITDFVFEAIYVCEGPSPSGLQAVGYDAGMFLWWYS